MSSAPQAAPPEKEQEIPLEAPPAVKETLDLLQPWIAYVPRQQRRISFYLALAIISYLGLFSFLRIDTTRTIEPHIPTTHLRVESPTWSGSSDLWDQLNDPRLYLFPRVSPFSQPPEFTFAKISSPLGQPTDLTQPQPAIPQDYEFIHAVIAPLKQRVVESLTPRRQRFDYQPPPLQIANQTTWVWDADLKALQPQNITQLPSLLSETDLNPTVLRIAVDATGISRFVMVEESCSKPELDEQAVIAARHLRFQPRELTASVLWGRATIFWHYAPEPQEIVLPTPPSTDK